MCSSHCHLHALFLIIRYRYHLGHDIPRSKLGLAVGGFVDSQPGTHQAPLRQAGHMPGITCLAHGNEVFSLLPNKGVCLFSFVHWENRHTQPPPIEVSEPPPPAGENLIDCQTTNSRAATATQKHSVASDVEMSTSRPVSPTRSRVSRMVNRSQCCRKAPDLKTGPVAGDTAVGLRKHVRPRGRGKIEVTAPSPTASSRVQPTNDLADESVYRKPLFDGGRHYRHLMIDSFGAREQPVEPPGNPPVGGTQERHQRRRQECPDYGRIERHGQRDPESQRLHQYHVCGYKGRSDYDHDQRRAGDDTAAALETCLLY